MTGNFRVKALVVALSLAAGAAAHAAVPASYATPLGNGTVAHATLLHQGDVVAGPLALSQPMHIAVALKLRNQSQLQSFIATAHQPGALVASKPLTSAQFVAQYSPTAAQAQAVADYLTHMGFTNVTIAPNRLLVSGDAPAGKVQAAFNTSFVSVRTHDGRQAYANTTEAHIPAALQDSVLSVIGLQDVHQAHTFARPVQASSVHPLAVTGHNPTEFASIYGGSGVPTAAGVTVGIITQGSLTNVKNDLNTFTSQNGLPTVTTQTVQTGGTSSDTSGDGEWDLDSQDIVGMGGGQVGKLIFYNIPTLANTNLTADINTVVSRNEAKIINVSLGECETSAQGDGSAAAQDQAFQQATAQGQTFSISTGDSGADECGTGGTTPSWPAASQYVIAAAGTTLDASTTTWNNETVWSGSGGSQSTFEPKPSWQTLWSGPRRGVADIAYDADPNSGSLVIVHGAQQQIGGTSLSAPLFAGAWARMIAAKGTSLGFAGPLIYQLPASAFHDITSGNNGGSTAGPGYDLASGRGSPIMSNVLSGLGGGGNQPPVASFTDTVNGLTVNFTDTSTDSDGTIASHSWTFGDGGTSTAANPSHTYAASGTYNVTETVTDNGGAQSSVTHSVTVSSGGGGSQLLGNPGFEGSASPWTMSSGVYCTNSTCSGETAHGGTGFAWLDGYGTTHTDTVSQQVAIPAGKTSATLSYFLHIDTAETTTTTAYDKLTVGVYSTSGTLLKTLATYSNLNKNTGYAVHTNSLASYIGQTVVIKFTGTEDSSLQTSFVLDDVTLNVQ